MSYVTAFSLRRSTMWGNALEIPQGASNVLFKFENLPTRFRIVRFAFVCETASPPNFSFKLRLYDRDPTLTGANSGYILANAVSPEYSGGTTTPIFEPNLSLLFDNHPADSNLGTLYVRLYSFSTSPTAKTNWALTLIGEW